MKVNTDLGSGPGEGSSKSSQRPAPRDSPIAAIKDLKVQESS